MAISKRDPRPPYQQIAATLRAEIEDGTYPAGSRLPSNAEMQRRFGVGNPTIQRAIGLLKSEGLVEGASGRGVFVRQRQSWILVPSSYLPPVPDGRDPWTAALADQGLAASQEIVRVEEVEPPAEIAEALNLADGDRAVLRQRVMLADGQPVELVESYYPSEIVAGTPVAEPRKVRGGARAVLAGLGYPPRESVEQVNTRMPTPDEAIALNLAEGVPVFRTLRTIFSDNDRPIEASIMVMAGDRYRLLYRLPIHQSA